MHQYHLDSYYEHLKITLLHHSNPYLFFESFLSLVTPKRFDKNTDLSLKFEIDSISSSNSANFFSVYNF